MDAMDITNLPVTPPEREVETKKEEYIEENVDSVGKEDVDLSFEDLMCSMFDEIMQKKEGISDESVKNSYIENEVLMNGEINVDEDVDSLIANVAQKKGFSNKEIESKNINDDKASIPLVNADFEGTDEDVPVIECELELSSSKIKDTKEKKSIKEEPVKEEKKEEVNETFLKEELETRVHLVKEKKEEPKKVDIKKEDKYEAVEELQDNLFAQKPKKIAKKLNISVEDLRTEQAVQIEQGLEATEEGQAGAFEGEPSFNDGKNISSSQASSSSQKVEFRENANGNQFSSILAEQIKANSAELVQRGKIVLRDGNVGEIRLQLKPAHLGVVRINLRMTGDKKMQGEVTVSSQEAYDAFEDSMEELVSSFKDAGFDTSSFNLNWKGGREEVVREDLRDMYFSPEKTALSLREKLNVTENVYEIGQAENINVLV